MPSTIQNLVIEQVQNMDYTIELETIIKVIWDNEPEKWEWYLSADYLDLADWVLTEARKIQQPLPNHRSF